MNKKQKKIVRVVVIVLALIGIATVIDNGIRLTKEIASTVKNHHWNMVVVR